jgi:N6-adenosine-specific RNA methylase IME4
MYATFNCPADGIAVLDEIRRVLAETTDLGQITSLRDQAEAVREYAQDAEMGLEMQNQAVELKLVAERRAGGILRRMRLHGGDRKSDRRMDTRLKGLGIAKEESSRWQREALLPEKDFQQYLRVTREEGKKLSARDVLRLACVHARKTDTRENLFGRLADRLQQLVEQRSKFRCIHVIPPWPEGRTPKADICRFVQELLDLPVRLVAGERAHLHLWTPPEILEDGLRILRAWGFDYRSSLVRTKPAAGCGSYWRQAHEILLLGVRGKLEFDDRSLLSWMDRRANSAAESLDEARSIVQRASPGPYLELFGGRATRGWTVLSP